MENKKQNLDKRAAQEKLQAKKRLEDAKIREEKKQQQEMLKDAKRQAAKKKAEVLKEQARQKALMKKQRKAAIARESAEQKKARIYAEKQERQLRAQAKKEAKLREKQQKIAAIKQKRAEKAEKRSKSKNYAGWLTAVVVLGVSVLALGSATSLLIVEKRQSDRALMHVYEKSFNDFVGYVDNLDVNLSKLTVASGRAEQQRLLTNVTMQAELAESNVQQLPLNDESKINTVAFINSVGDYAHSLSNKLSKGGELSTAERDNLNKLHKINISLKKGLGDMSGKMAGKYSFMSLFKGKDGDLVISGFGELENQSMEYPKLIYDGPFSAGLEERDVKGLNGLTEISRQQAEDKVREYFKDYGIQDISYTGEAEGQGFATYNFDITAEGGDMLFAQISKKGGKLIMFNMLATCKTTNFDKDICIDIAEKFLQSLGIENMKAVWINDSDSLATINFVYESGDVIVYPDMIKVKVCEESGKVLGMEARGYYLNHTGDRKMSGSISIDAARAGVSDRLSIQTQRKVIIPKAGGGEIAAYEFMGEYDGATYYVYIDAATGQEAEVFKVIKSTEGELLL